MGPEKSTKIMILFFIPIRITRCWGRRWIWLHSCHHWGRQECSPLFLQTNVGTVSSQLWLGGTILSSVIPNIASIPQISGRPTWSDFGEASPGEQGRQVHVHMLNERRPGWLRQLCLLLLAQHLLRQVCNSNELLVPPAYLQEALNPYKKQRSFKFVPKDKAKTDIRLFSMTLLSAGTTASWWSANSWTTLTRRKLGGFGGKTSASKSSSKIQNNLFSSHTFQPKNTYHTTRVS